MNDCAASRAAEVLRARVPRLPEVALVLGSGLGGLGDAVGEPVVVRTSEVAGYPAPTVSGHRGRLVFGMLEDVPVVIVQGRVHLYEGHSITKVTYPVRLVHALGARLLVLTNAAGGINAAFVPGTLMLITDHINLAGAHLTFPAGLSERSMPGRPTEGQRGPYSTGWLDRAEKAAVRRGVPVRRGTYVWVRGPSYETKAEIAAFRRIGADAVGMSTVPEALQAAALEMDVLGVSTITNPAAGLGRDTLSHEDVLLAGKRVHGDLERLIRGVLQDERGGQARSVDEPEER